MEGAGVDAGAGGAPPAAPVDDGEHVGAGDATAGASARDLGGIEVVLGDQPADDRRQHLAGGVAVALVGRGRCGCGRRCGRRRRAGGGIGLAHLLDLGLGHGRRRLGRRRVGRDVGAGRRLGIPTSGGVLGRGGFSAARGRRVGRPRPARRRPRPSRPRAPGSRSGSRRRATAPRSRPCRSTPRRCTSSSSIRSPTFFSHLVIVPSVTVSPSWGIVMSAMTRCGVLSR